MEAEGEIGGCVTGELERVSVWPNELGGLARVAL